MLKRSVCGQWTHPICVLFTVELTVDGAARADNLGDMDPDRRDLKCEICAERGSCCVQCRQPECLKAFHPYCAYDSRTQMLTRDMCYSASEGGERYTSHEIYCKAHRGRVSQKTGAIMSCRVPVQKDEDGVRGKSGKTSKR
jgi:hypothetical protein